MHNTPEEEKIILWCAVNNPAGTSPGKSDPPPGVLAAVLASRFGCDSSLDGWMVVGTYGVSLVTIPLVFCILPA